MMRAVQDDEEAPPPPPPPPPPPSAAAPHHRHRPEDRPPPSNGGGGPPPLDPASAAAAPSPPTTAAATRRASSPPRRSQRRNGRNGVPPSSCFSSAGSRKSSRPHGGGLLRDLSRRKAFAYTLPLLAFVLVHIALDVRPSSYLPGSFLEGLKWEWSLGGSGGGGGGAGTGEGGGVAGTTSAAETAAAASPEAAAAVARMDAAASASVVASARPPLPPPVRPMPPPADPSALPPPMAISPSVARRVDSHPYDLLRDVSDLPVNLDDDLPYFWHVHKSGGSTMKHILYCLGRTQTRRIDEEGCSDTEPDLKVCRREFGTAINADASSVAGIERAIELKLSERVFPEIQDSRAFVVDTSRVYEAMPIFQPYRRGRLFVLFRHPVERAVSKYHYIKIATWERNYKPEIRDMSLMEYARSRYCYSNWMVRRLVHKMRPDEEVTGDDLDLAKEVLRRKALVLLTEDMAGAAERVRRYFHWSDEALDLDAERQNCLITHIYLQPMNANPHPALDPQSPEWAAIRDRNLLDIELVGYARELYVGQGEMIRRTVRGGTYSARPPPVQGQAPPLGGEVQGQTQAQGRHPPPVATQPQQ